MSELNLSSVNLKTGDIITETVFDTLSNNFSEIQIQGNKHELSIDENVTQLLESTGYGVIKGLITTAQSAPNMTIKITSGIVHMPNGTRLMSTGNNSLTIAVADTTNPRIDIVYVATDSTIGYLVGTPASSPSAPITPTGAFLLAQIGVPKNTTTITNSNITDKRMLKQNNNQLSDKIDLLTGVNTTQLSDVVNRFQNSNGNYIELSSTQKGNNFKALNLPHNFIDIINYSINNSATIAVQSDGSVQITPNGIYSGVILQYICTLKTNKNAYISFYGKADSTRQITLWDGSNRHDINYLTTTWTRYVIPITYKNQTFSFFGNIDGNAIPFYIKNIQIDTEDNGYIDYGEYEIVSSTIGFNKNKSSLLVTATDIGYQVITNLKSSTNYCFDSNGHTYTKVQVTDSNNVVTTYGGTITDLVVNFTTPTNVTKIVCWYKSNLSNMVLNTDILDSDLKGVKLYEVLNCNIIKITDNIDVAYLKTFDQNTIISSDVNIDVIYGTNAIGNDLLMANHEFIGVSNPNLLINGDFQIWQRGTSFTNVDNGAYTADRWRADNNITSALTISQATNGLKMTWVATASGTLKYHMESDDKTKLIGKKVTCSISVNNILYTGVVTIFDSYTYVTFDLNKKTFSTTESTTSTTLLILIHHDNAPSGTTYTLNYCKLELGSIATPFIPRLYTEEVLLCKRFYQKINRLGSNYPVIGQVATVANSTSCYLEIPLSIPMRIMPTCTFKGSIVLFSTTNTLTYSSVQSMTASFIKIASILSTAATTTGFQMCEGNNDTNADVLLDSEIYS